MKTTSFWGTLLLALALLSATSGAALAAASQNDPSAKCVKCHSKNLKKQLEDGETLSLHVPTAEFDQSVHSGIGCVGCHADVTKGKHPSREPIASHRALSLRYNQSCHSCHEDKYTAYEGSVHAHMVAAGDRKAPLCSDCHGSHTIRQHAVYEPASGEPCSNCHADIYTAYEQSVHGQARIRGNVIRDAHVQAPICADCHRAHDVSAVASVDYLRETCLGCHDGAMAAHEKWLPNAGMHLSAVACAACHSPMAERRVDLQLYDKVRQLPVTDEQEALPSASAAASSDSAKADADLDPVGLWKLVREQSREGQPVDVTLRGRLEVTTGVAAHRIAPRAEAVRSCESCHQRGAEPFQEVTVSISRADGRKQRVDADDTVLSSVVSVDSVGDFYAPGGTRIRLFDLLLVLALVGGLAIPIGHYTLGRILRKREREQ